MSNIIETEKYCKNAVIGNYVQINSKYIGITIRNKV